MEKHIVVKATKEGRLYIKSSDFFKQEKVKELVVKLQASSILREIKKHKEEELETA